MSIIKTSEDSVVINSYYDCSEEKVKDISENERFILQSSKEDFLKKDRCISANFNKNGLNVESYTSDPDYTRNATFDYGRHGEFTMTTFFERTSKGSEKSYWDIKTFNTTRAGYSMYTTGYWTVDYLTTRLSVEPYANEVVLKHGPNTMNNTSSVSAGIDVGVDLSVDSSWTFYLNDVSCINDSDLPIYGRWEWNYFRNTAAARKTFSTEPGIRVSNAKGKFALQCSNNITFYNELLGSTEKEATGIQTYVVPDR